MQISSRSPRSRSSNDEGKEIRPQESVCKTPKEAFFSIRNLEDSSIPPSSVADKSEPYQDEEEDYKSMWADISEHTVGRNGSTIKEAHAKVASAVKEDPTETDGNLSKNDAEDPETESSIFYNFNTPFSTSI